MTDPSLAPPAQDAEELWYELQQIPKSLTARAAILDRLCEQAEKNSSWESAGHLRNRTAGQLRVLARGLDKQAAVVEAQLAAQATRLRELEAERENRLKADWGNHHNALLCPYCNPHKSLIDTRAAAEAARPAPEARLRAHDVEVFYVPNAGWTSKSLGYVEGVGPYFSLPEALRRAEKQIGESAWRPADLHALTRSPEDRGTK